MAGPTNIEIGARLVSLVNAGKEADALEQLYDPKIVSIEGQGSEEMPARIDGIEAVRGKHAWWYANNEVHASTAAGPYCGHRPDQFAVQFAMDITPKGGERMQMDEVALFTVKNGKIVQEEYLYRMG